MQLMPETAQWCAEQMGISYEPTQLFDPQYNVRMGCFYLSYLIGRYQNVELALAAYNTGFVNVDQWLEQGVITRDTKSLQNIPIEETANYVVRVRSAKEMYDLFYREGLPDEKTQEHTLRLAFSNWKKALGVLTGQR